MSNIPPEVFELPLFARFEAKNQKRLRKLVEGEASLEVCPAETVFAHQGEYLERFCVILQGGVTMYRKEAGETKVLGAFGQRDWFGELGALSSQPEPATLRADTRCTFLVCEEALFKQLYKDAGFREQVDETYRRLSLAVHLRVAPLFKGLTASELRALDQHVTMVDFEKGDVVANEGEEADAVYLVRTGAVGCTTDGGKRILGYYMANSSFGERALTGSKSWPGTYRAMAATAALRIRVDALQQVFAREPRVLEVLQRTAGYILAEELGEATGLYDVAHRTDDEASRQAPLSAEGLEVMVGKQSVKGGEALVIDLHACVRCNACVESCVAVHEDRVPRLSKTGTRVVSKETGHTVTLATSCYNCEIPECMMACNYGAIRRDVQGLIRYVWDNCVGCKMCSTACPYGVISMTPPPAPGATEPRFARHWFLQTIPFLGKRFRGRHPVGAQAEVEPDPEAKAVGKLRGVKTQGKAIKCDLCAGLPFEACVYNCPTQAIVRINPEKVLTGRDRRDLLPKH